MVNNNEKKNEEVGEILPKLMNQKFYEINIQGADAYNPKKKTIDSVLWADEFSHNIVYKIFLILQGENRFTPKFKRSEDIFSLISDILYDEFYTDIKAKKELNIEKSLEKKIQDLEENKFLTSKGFGKNYDSVADEYEEISIEEVKDMIRSLRKRRIKVYKAVLKEFKKDTDKYLKYLTE